ncbi:hypothetical protein ACPPVW_04960 [Leifsonia sp. McL0607]|uniref:hypothetical protein n=1 Tax=Leifsonia sp. McL0607 TaxID=3415672 RepID=UPI003CE9C6B6
MRTSTLVPVVAGLVAVAAIAIAAGPTYSALTAGADLIVSAGDSTAAGSSGPIDLVTIDGHEVATRTNDSAAFVPLAADDRYAPGHTFHLEVGVADNDPDVAAAITVAVVGMDSAGTGVVGTSPNLTPLLRVTVVDTTTGHVLVGHSATDASRGAPVADASATIAHVTQRDADPLNDGDRWTDGAAGSRHELEIMVYCPDSPAALGLTGGRSDLALMLYGIGQP